MEWGWAGRWSGAGLGGGMWAGLAGLAGGGVAGDGRFLLLHIPQ